MELTPVVPVAYTLTPSQEGDIGPFGNVKRDFSDFKNLKDTFATFALLKVGYP